MTPKITVMKFSAPWCQPCVLMAPAWKKAEEEYAGRVTFEDVNTDTEEGRARAVGRYILGLPTIIFQKNGFDVARVDGAMRFPQLKKQIESLLS